MNVTAYTRTLAHLPGRRCPDEAASVFRGRSQRLLSIAGIVALLGPCSAGCGGSQRRPLDPALAKVGPAPCAGVAGDYTNLDYAAEYFLYSGGTTSFPNVMGYLGIRFNLPMSNGGLNKFMLTSGEIWVDEIIPTGLQDVLSGTPDPIGVFARGVAYEMVALDHPNDSVKLSVPKVSDLSFCYGDTLLDPP